MSYRNYSDKELERAIKEAVLADRLLRYLLTYRRISIEVQENVAILRGHAPTRAHGQRVEHIARSIPDLQRVDNRIVTDDWLERQVAQALAHDPRTRPEIISVTSSLGHVHLSGTVADERVRLAAEEVAASVSEVRGIVNVTRLRGYRFVPKPPRLLRVAIGSPVYSLDNVQLGTVDRVVLSPHSRRLTAVIVQGAFPDPQGSKPVSFPDQWPKQRRTVVIPAQHISRATDGGTFLRLTALEAAGEADLHTVASLTPVDDWQPPFPYRGHDVLLEGGRAVVPALPLEAVPIERHLQSREVAPYPKRTPEDLVHERRQPVAV